MTLVSDLIADAYRCTNLIALGQSPTAAQTTEALRLLNRVVKSVFGNEVGEKLIAYPVGLNNVAYPTGYPWGNSMPEDGAVIPTNVRVIFNLEPTADLNLYLHPNPSPGARFAYNMIDPLNGAAVTIHGNGRYIGGAATLVLDGTPSESEYMYRDDTANWVLYAPLVAGDTFPFPEEFDDFFIITLALELNPAYGVTIDGQTQTMLQRAQKQIRARYHQVTPTPAELALNRLSISTQDRYVWDQTYWSRGDYDNFLTGWPW